MVSRATELLGTEEAEPEAVCLRAGPVSAVLQSGALRWIKLNDIEVLRSITFTIRDKAWGTITPTIREIEIDDAGPGFAVRITANCLLDGGTLTWRGEI